MKTNKLLNTGKSLTKLLEACNWLLAVSLVAQIVIVLVVPMVTDVELPTEYRGPQLAGMFLDELAAVVSTVLTALIFRFLHQILKNAQTGTPFCQDNIRLLHRIGVFALVSPTLSLVAGGIATHLLGATDLPVTVGLDDFCMGVIVLCLTQFFIHGAELEEDVEGLL